jgi:hypothetical protein
VPVRAQSIPGEGSHRGAQRTQERAADFRQAT